MKKLSGTERDEALAGIPEWKRSKEEIDRTFEFADFEAAIAFVNRVAAAAEKAAHHPDIEIRWNKVRLTLTTHDAGGLTTKDISLATRCDALATQGAKGK